MIEIVMPQPGETVAEALIVSWLKAVGDDIAAGETLFEIETDKATMEVPSLKAGRLIAINVAAGETAPVGTIVALIGGPGDLVPAAVTGPPAAMEIPRANGHDPLANFVRTPTGNFGPARRADGSPVTPLARRIAAQQGVDLAAIKGSGPRGRVVAADVRGATTAEPEPEATPRIEAEPSAIRAAYAATRFEELPIDGMRRAIARRLTASKQHVPHFYLTTSMGVGELLALRTRINEQTGRRITINDWVVKAYALALAQVAEANAIWADDAILRFASCDVGVAVSVEGGLFTPVVRDAETKSLGLVSDEIRSFADRARNGSLTPADYAGGVATISNLGAHGVEQFQGIVNPPQSTILAVGSVVRAAIETADGAAFESRMTVTISADHRVIDGVLAARLLSAFKSLVETPTAIIV